MHTKCRRNLTDQKRVNSNVDAVEVPPSKRLRSSISPFNWKEDCMLCGKSAVVNTRHPDRSRVQAVTALPMHDKVLECCHKRGDLWASEVETRVYGCIDLVAAEAVYCFSRFMLNKGLGGMTSNVAL